MKHNKLTYESPVIVSLHVCVEGILCRSLSMLNESVTDTGSDAYNTWEWTF